jgi:beta-lactamase regulating signal transducer with metallopeptidase domain
MSLDRLPLDALRVALLLGLALSAVRLLRRAPAEQRRLCLALALGGALVLPAVSSIAPAWRIVSPPSVAALKGRPFAEPLVEGRVAVALAGAGVAPLPDLPATMAPSRHVDPLSILAAVWALGALVVVARLVAGLARSRAIVRRASPAPAWASAVERAARVTGIRADVRVTDELDGPALTSALSPVVLVPRASETWSEPRRFAVLLHELAHVRQRDCLAQILAQLACALHWFDPLVWIAARRLRFERELAADDAVIAAGTRPSSYAEDLLAIAGARAVPDGALGMAEPSSLALRISAIVAARRAEGPLSRPRAVLIAAGAGAVLLAVACATPESPEPLTASAPPPLTPPAAAAPTSAGAISTIDPRIQQIADEELDRTVTEWQAAAGAVVVLDPSTGEILANAGRDHGARADVAVQRAYITGSTLKAITLAAALDEGVVTAADRFDCENGARSYGAKVLHDAGPNGSLTVPEMLAVSTNVGFSKVFDRLGGDRLGRWLRRFHFGAAPGLAGAAAGEVPARIEDRSFDGAVVAIGEAMTASPLQVAAAYAAFANDGAYVAPTLTRRADRAAREPLMRPETSRAVLSMLEGVVNGEHATGTQARVAGARVAGKTGTAEWASPGGAVVYASFVGIVPADRPRFVILVGVEAPRAGGTGGSVAAPAFARVASRALAGGG